jgi:hypothetical protein
MSKVCVDAIEPIGVINPYDDVSPYIIEEVAVSLVLKIIRAPDDVMFCVVIDEIVGGVMSVFE